MNELRDVVRRVRARLRSVLAVSVGFGVFEAAVLAPLGALLLDVFLARHGKAAVGNFEIAAFLLSPTGLVGLLVVGAVALAGAYLHLACLLRVLGDPPATAIGALRALLRDGQRLVRLGALQLGAVLALAVPLSFAMLFLVRTVWGDRDLNGLLVLKPPVFWYGVAAAAVPALLLVFLLLALSLRWLFALPIVVGEARTWPYRALRESAARTRGRHLAHLRALAMLAAAVLVVSAAYAAIVAAAGSFALERVGADLRAVVAVAACVVVGWAAGAFLVHALAMALLAGLVDRLHRAAEGLPAATGLAGRERLPRSFARKAAVAIAVLAVAATFAGYRLLKRQRLTDHVELTAHRMGAVGGPENTVAALRRAIADGAEWAELDVQLTSDGALVVLHDFDLVRIGGPAKRVADATLAEIRAIDVGRGLGRPGFDGERVPTLDEVIAAAGDRIRLNIELKPPTPASAAPLADAVLAAIRRAGLSARCHVCSQSYEALRRVKDAEPSVGIGYIAGAALGDLSRLEVDFLMVSERLATDALVRQAHARGVHVHVWTVNDPGSLPSLVDRGVDDVITDAPEPMRRRLEELRALDLPERLLLRVRHLLTP